MSALTADRNTPSQRADVISAWVAAGKTIYAGALVAYNGSGYATPGATATGLTALGRADEYVDNSGGGDGDVPVRVRRHEAFYWDQSSTDPVTPASLGKTCYIVDDHTVSATDGSGTQSAAGIVVDMDENGVWVE